MEDSNRILESIPSIVQFFHFITITLQRFKCFVLKTGYILSCYFNNYAQFSYYSHFLSYTRFSSLWTKISMFMIPAITMINFFALLFGNQAFCDSFDVHKLYVFFKIPLFAISSNVFLSRAS